jgi:hypothetical protein
MGPVAWLILCLLVLGLITLSAVVALGVSLIRDMVPSPQSSAAGSDQAAQALARLLSSMHPDVEVLSVDNKNNTVTLRDRRTHRKITQDIESARMGRFRFAEGAESDGGDSATGFPTVHHPVSLADLNQPFKVPAWIPSYPFSEPRGALPGPNGGTFRFRTNDTVIEVLSFYQEALKRSGFQITATGAHGPSKSLQGMLTAMDAHGARNVLVTTAAGATGTSVTLTFTAK